MLQCYVLLCLLHYHGQITSPARQTYDKVFIVVTGVYLSVHLGNLLILLGLDIKGTCKKYKAKLNV